MKSTEELRETLLGMEREVARLRTETSHANLLLEALEALLRDEGEDPFAGVFAALRSVFGFSHCLVLAEPGDQAAELECVVAEPAGLKATSWPCGQLFRKVLAGRVAATFSNDGLEEWAAPEGAAGPAGLSAAQPALYMPMRVRNRRGVLMLLRREGEGGFDRGHVALARKFALLASHAFAARHAHQSEAESQRLRSLTARLQQTQDALAHRANYDHLTGLPNRSFMQELVERALADRGREPSRIALAFIDLDNFKQVNDLYNHAVGDALLKSVAARIRGRVRQDDLVGRISGDEFVILFRNVEHGGELERMAGRVLDELKRPFAIDGTEISISASIGVARHPEHGADYDSLRRNADTAMYRAKLSAKGSVACFDSEMGTLAAARLTLEKNLRHAIRARQFRAAFQPKVDLSNGRVVGFEALARLVDEEGRVHGPASFIGPASEFGVLNDIAGFVLDDVLRSLRVLDATFGPDTRISFNVSARQASDPAFMAELIQRLATAPGPRRFIFEVTEDAVVAASVFQSKVLPLLREAGVSVSIDDFGTGYSSLSALTDITADELKVDRSFISSIHRRPRSQSILKAIESLGGTLGMRIVAEGVETQEELDYLLSTTTIRLAQGYFFSKPRFVEDLSDSPLAANFGVPGFAEGPASRPSAAPPEARRAKDRPRIGEDQARATAGSIVA